MYIERHLKLEAEHIHEDQLLSLSKCIVVLAEPGAGKTELLSNLAKKSNSTRFRASIFKHHNSLPQHETLIIDGCDEVAKIDQSAIETVIAKACQTGARRIIFASRASEWDELRYSRFIRDFLDLPPRTVRLLPFDQEEQHAFFRSLFPAGDFLSFLSVVKTYGLDVVLGNPLLFQLFVRSYQQNEGRFGSRQDVFNDAITYLVNEHNLDMPKQNRPTRHELVTASEEVFAKLLLSGATGVRVF